LAQRQKGESNAQVTVKIIISYLNSPNRFSLSVGSSCAAERSGVLYAMIFGRALPRGMAFLENRVLSIHM